LRKHWNLDDIPDAVVMATFLDPATVDSSIFTSTIKRDNSRVDLRSHARSIIVDKVPNVLHVVLHNDKASDTDTNTDLSKDLGMEYRTFLSIVDRDPLTDLWDDPRPWWQRNTPDLPLLSSVSRVCFSIQATSIPSTQLFHGTQGTEGILADPQGDSNEYTFIRLLSVRNLHRFLYGDRAPQLDITEFV
jgi:hypothetical protein